jgi:hypothetical protein
MEFDLRKIKGSKCIKCPVDGGNLALIPLSFLKDGDVAPVGWKLINRNRGFIVCKGQYGFDLDDDFEFDSYVYLGDISYAEGDLFNRLCAAADNDTGEIFYRKMGGDGFFNVVILPPFKWEF